MDIESPLQTQTEETNNCGEKRWHYPPTKWVYKVKCPLKYYRQLKKSYILLLI